jgi:ubiquinone/menaquinone biosynthesis C-methylase UbiE
VDSHLTAWDKDYRNRGRLWGGAVKDLPQLPPGTAVLELGCGDGKTLAGMPGDWKTAALDISPEALRLCHRTGPEAELILADASLLPFRGESFDAVFAFHVTGHLLLPARRALAREAARVLRAGGHLFLREFGLDDMRAGNGEEVESGTFRRGEGMLTHYFTEAEVSQLFCDQELQSIRTHRWKLRVKGKDLMRAEIEAVFFKI